MDETQPLKIPNKSHSLYMLHVHAYSLSRNFDDLENLLTTTNMNFDIIAISETSTTKNINNIFNINLNNYAFEF